MRDAAERRRTSLLQSVVFIVHRSVVLVVARPRSASRGASGLRPFPAGRSPLAVLFVAATPISSYYGAAVPALLSGNKSVRCGLRVAVIRPVTAICWVRC